MINLEEAKKQFLAQYVMASPLTQQKYKGDVELFLQVCEIDTLDKANDFNETDIAKFYDYAKSRNWSAGSINQKLTVVKIFWKWLTRKHYISENFLEDIKRLRYNSEVKFTPTPEAMEKFLQYIKDHTDKKRLYLMVKLLISSGLRRSELTHLKINDINKENCTIRIKGKGNKIVEQPVPANILLEIVDYIDSERKETMARYTALGGKDLGYIFVGNIGKDCTPEKKDLTDGDKVDENSFFMQVKLHAKNCGVEGMEKLSIHSLRRVYITNIYEKTGDIVIAQKAARHSSSATTVQCYVNFNKDKLKDVVNDLYAEPEPEPKVEDIDFEEYKQFLAWKKKMENN